MGTFLLDTNIIIDVLNDKRDRSQLLSELTEVHGHILACCPINVAEVYAGMRSNEEARTNALLRSLLMYPITFDIAEFAGTLKRDHAKKGITLSLTDAIIAAVAIRNHITLITDNVKHFAMTGLKLHPLPGRSSRVQ